MSETLTLVLRYKKRTLGGVDEAAHVELTLVGAAAGYLGLLLLALLNLGCLVLHLTGTSKRSVDLT